MSPEEHLVRLMKDFPRLGEIVEIFVSARGEKNFSDWPQWCFLPMAGWIELVRERLGNEGLEQYGEEIARVAAIGTWRYSQGIYNFDDELYNALMASEHNGKIPVELFKNLPEWSLYIPIKSDDVVFDGEKINGFWVHLEFDVNTGREELRFLFNTQNGLLLPAILHLQYETLDESLKSVLEVSIENLGQSDNELVKLLVDTQQEQKKIIKKVLPLVLYLVSEPPEEDEHIKNPTLGYPTLKKTKKGFRLFPARGIKKWKVGENIGETLRKERASAMSGHSAGTKKAPHLRRGHWHGYWHGKGRSKYKVKWVKPTFVGSE